MKSNNQLAKDSANIKNQTYHNFLSKYYTKPTALNKGNAKLVLFRKLWALVDESQKSGVVTKENLAARRKLMNQLMKERLINANINVPYLPNVRSYELPNQSIKHPILGTNVSVGQVAKSPYKNRLFNAKVLSLFQKLFKELGTKEFWNTANNLLNDPGYAVMCYNHVQDRWYKLLNFMRVRKSLLKFFYMDRSKYEYRTVGIPKPNGEIRPLSVASVEWRIIHYSLLNILQLWLSVYIPFNQHGFQPGLGTSTAWRTILQSVIRASDIYEFDLKKFFDTVNLDYLRGLLIALAIPVELIDLIIAWNRTQPLSGVLGAHQVWESDRQKAQTYIYHCTGIWCSDLTDLQEKEALREMNDQIKIHPEMAEYSYYYGVGQGSPLSPLISTIVLVPELLLNKEFSVLQYADDGLIYKISEEGKKLLSSGLKFRPESGISLSIPKSSWIKKDNQWLKPLKFLGIIYLTKELLITNVDPTLTALIPPETAPDGILVTATRDAEKVIYTSKEVLGNYQKAEFFDLLFPYLISSFYGRPLDECENVQLGDYNRLLDPKFNDFAKSKIDELWKEYLKYSCLKVPSSVADSPMSSFAISRDIVREDLESTLESRFPDTGLTHFTSTHDLYSSTYHSQIISHLHNGSWDLTTYSRNKERIEYPTWLDIEGKAIAALLKLEFKAEGGTFKLTERNMSSLACHSLTKYLSAKVKIRGNNDWLLSTKPSSQLDTSTKEKMLKIIK